MGRLSLAVVSLVLVLAVSRVTSQRPGVQIRILQNGLNMAAQVATDRLAAKVTNKVLPAVEGKRGKTSYGLSNIRITSFQKPRSLVTVRPSPGLTWSASNAAINIQGDWRYRTKLLFIRISDHGRFYVSASGVSFSISVKMGKDSAGRPTVWSTGCTSSINSLSVRIRGSPVSFLYNLLKSLFKRKIKGEAEKLMCNAAKKSITEDLQQQLSQIDVMTNIGREMVLDYRLIQNPIFGTGYLQSQHKGEFRARTRPLAFSVQPAPFPSAASAPSRMVNVWGSDYVINSFAFSAFNLGMAQYNLTAQDILSSKRQYLRTSCNAPAICLGTVLPAVSGKYPPGTAVILNLKATSAPSIRTSRAGITLTLPGQVSLYVGRDTIFKFGLLLNTTVSVRLDGHSVRARVLSLNAQFRDTESTLGTIPDTVLQYLFDQFAKPAILKKLNELGQKGVDIPNIKGTKFTRPAFILNEGSLMLAADVALDVRPTVRPTPRPRPPVRGRRVPIRSGGRYPVTGREAIP